MLSPIDRRTVTASLAITLATAGRVAWAEPANLLDRVIDGPLGPPLASAGLIARRGDGSIALKSVAGRAFGPAGSRAFDVDQPFRVASVSKLVTTSVFMDFAVRAGLDLDGDASDLVGFRLRHPNYPGIAITPRMLLSHTSGLRNGLSYPVPLGHRLSEAFSPEGRHFDGGAWFGPQEHRPGDWFAYADVNFALIAQILERLVGERFDIHTRRALFEPLGLDVGYNWSGVSQTRRVAAAAAVRLESGAWKTQVDDTVPPSPGLALSRAPDAPDLEASDYKVGENGFVFSPHGGLRASLSDMDRLARLYAAGGLWRGTKHLSRAALESMETRTWTFDPAHPNGETDDGLLQSYGLGCEAPCGRQGPGGDAFFGCADGDWRGHFGDAYGWITGLFWNRRDGRTLVYALNGMPATMRPKAQGSSLTAPEEALINLALSPTQGRHA